MIRRLGLNEIEKLYKERIKKDFPLIERRPLFLIRKLYQKDRYVCLVLEENNRILAYGTFLYDASIDNVLLEYFAVDKNLRGSGVGSRFLKMLQEYWKDKCGILLECELPDAAKKEKDRQNRKRRIGFYQRGGAIITQMVWRAFGVAYNILWLQNPASSTGQEELPEDFMKLYTLSLPKFIKVLFVKMSIEEDQK